MIEGTAYDTTVSYFRTTLDPLDLYRIDNIINHGADDDVSTPAAALATHLRGQGCAGILARGGQWLNKPRVRRRTT